MGQDLSAACWQAGMGSKPGSDPKTQLDSCTQTWQVTQKVETCEMFYTSIRKLDEQQAAAKCTSAPVKSQLQQLKSPAPAPSTEVPHL
ncbi:hypothetical protein AO265_16090 [Pseudomonas sp. ABAC61]|nr:hypothetical protein AO265_16090 [Pseudomonas sp. ABAC61]